MKWKTIFTPLCDTPYMTAAARRSRPFMGEFITLLDQEGFSYKDLLDAIADWSNEQPGLEKVVNHLESSINEIYHIYKR